MVAPDFEVVPDFRVGEQLYQTWQEVVEQKVEVPAFPLREAWQTAHEFEFPSSRALEPIRGEDGKITAVLVRRQDAVRGTIEVTGPTNRRDGVQSHGPRFELHSSSA